MMILLCPKADVHSTEPEYTTGRGYMTAIMLVTQEAATSASRRDRGTGLALGIRPFSAAIVRIDAG